MVRTSGVIGLDLMTSKTIGEGELESNIVVTCDMKMGRIWRLGAARRSAAITNTVVLVLVKIIGWKLGSRQDPMSSTLH